MNQNLIDQVCKEEPKYASFNRYNKVGRHFENAGDLSNYGNFYIPMNKGVSSDPEEATEECAKFCLGYNKKDYAFVDNPETFNDCNSFQLLKGNGSHTCRPLTVKEYDVNKNTIVSNGKQITLTINDKSETDINAFWIHKDAAEKRR
jgi:hypothetical protein